MSSLLLGKYFISVFECGSSLILLCVVHLCNLIGPLWATLAEMELSLDEPTCTHRINLYIMVSLDLFKYQTSCFHLYSEAVLKYLGGLHIS